MTPLLNYPLEWTLSLAVLLGAYKLGLEQQAMHQLKRVYLLGTLVVSLMIPFVAIDVPPGTLPFALRTPPSPISSPDRVAVQTADKTANNNRQMATYSRADTPPPNPAHWPIGTLAGGLYGAITLLMLTRFGRNLYRLSRQVHNSPTQPFEGATLVRMPNEGLPYTFLHYLFVSDAAYSRGKVEPKLLTHELAHIRQRHSMDVLLVEIVLCAGWFNPLLWGLKRAVQLNHEFLADQAVNDTYQNIPDYQQLLLGKLTPAAPPLALASTLTFQTTKQRLLMMTKQSTPARRWLATSGTVLLFGTLITAMTVQTVAQQVPALTKPVSKNASTPPFGRKLTPEEMNHWFSDKKVDVHGGDRWQANQVLYRDLTPDQKKRVEHVVTEPRKQPTEAQWNDWHNTKKYGLWVDEKRRRDNPLDTKYKRTEIVYFWSSYVYKNARQPEGYTHQLELYTEPGYQELLKGDLEHPSLHLREGKTDAPKRRK